ALVSVREGLPRAVLEAMACGVPVVATSVPGTREAVRHGETGLLVELGDVAGLAAALSTLIADPGLRAAVGAGGRAVAGAEFDERRVIDALERIYRAELHERLPRAGVAARGGAAAPAPPPTPAPGAAPGAAVTVGRNFSFRLASQIASALLNVAAL